MPLTPTPLPSSQVVAGALLLGGYQGLRFSGWKTESKAQLLPEEIQSPGGVSNAQEQQAVRYHRLLWWWVMLHVGRYNQIMVTVIYCGHPL